MNNNHMASNSPRAHHTGGNDTSIQLEDYESNEIALKTTTKAEDNK